MSTKPISLDEAVSQVLTVEVDKWEKVGVAEGLVIYRQEKYGFPGLHEYFVQGVLKGIPPEMCHATLMDLDYRRIWDHYKPEHLRVYRESDEVVEEGSFLDAYLESKEEHERIYWLKDLPWPLKPREYVVRRSSEIKRVHGENAWIIAQEAVPTRGSCEDSLTQEAKYIRVQHYHQYVVIREAPQAPGSTLVHYRYFEDPRGSIPPKVYSWAVSHGVPTWIHRFKRACTLYAQARHRPEGSKVDQGLEELRGVLDVSLTRAFTM